jgi:hypothetical protein
LTVIETWNYNVTERLSVISERGFLVENKCFVPDLEERFDKKVPDR